MNRKIKLPKLPNNWEIKKLSEVCPLQRGFDLPQNKIVRGEFPVVYSNGILNFHSEYKVKGPGVVTGRSGTIGKIIFVEEDFWPHNTTLWVTNFFGNFPKFIYYLLQSLNFEKYNSGTSVPTLNRNDLHPVEVTIPPFPEQQIIVQILSIWDKAIEKTVTLINSKVKLKKTLMQQLLTGKLRFKEFVKSTKRVETRYGKIPFDWKYPRIEDIADEVSDRNINGRNIPVLSCTKYEGLVNSLLYFGKRIFSKDTSNYKIVRRDQFAYATNHIEEGSIGLLNLLDEGLVSPMYTVFKTKANVYAPFLYKVFKTELYRHIFEVNTSGSIDRRGSLRWKHFSQIHIPLPSIEEQKKISACIDTCDRGIKLLQQLADALKTQKKGLMQKLLTGKIRVKV